MPYRHLGIPSGVGNADIAWQIFGNADCQAPHRLAEPESSFEKKIPCTLSSCESFEKLWMNSSQPQLHVRITRELFENVDAQATSPNR